MALQAGTSTGSSYENSMASAMEVAFKEEWQNFMGNAPVPESNPQMQLMFVSIAKGIVQHLHDNFNAFAVHVDINSGDGAVSAISIDPDPTI